MRGIASSGGQSATVGFYLDETPLSPPASAQNGKVTISPDLYDVARVEILRGPQGTLYGSGSMGGTIKLVTNQPDAKAFYGGAQAVTSETQTGGLNYGFNAMVNIPLWEDKVALRIVGSHKQADGWLDRIVLNPFPQETNGGATRANVAGAPVGQDHKDVNNEDLTGGRIALLIQPTDRLTITPGVFYQRITQKGLSYSDSSPTGVLPAHYEPFDVAEPFSDTFTLYSLKAQYDFDAFQITSATADFVRRSVITEETAEPAQQFLETIIGIPDVAYAAVGPLATYEQDNSRQFSQELRITSKGDGAFQWLFGGFYGQQETKRSVSTNTSGPIVQEIFGAPYLYDNHQEVDYEQYAAFGEASYKFFNNFKATVGLRYFSYTNEDHRLQSGGLVTGGTVPKTFTLGASYSGVNPKFNLSYTASSDLLLYAQASKGFRPGSGNQSAPISCPGATPLQYDPDSLWSYEIGEKAQLFDRRVTVNGALYYEDWSGIQQTVTKTCGFSYTANAGAAGVYGGELEISGRITPDITLSNSAGYTYAANSSVVPGSEFTVGEKIQQVPAWTNTTSISYSRPVSNTFSFVARATNEYTDSMTDVSYGINVVPSRDIVNLRLGLVGDKVSAFLFIDNATDNRNVIGNTNNISFNPSDFNRAITSRPRTIGIDLSYSFDGRATH